MKRIVLFKCSLLAIWILFSGCGPSLPEGVEVAYDTLPAKLDYNIHVKPVLSDKCFLCHGPDAARRAADMRLDVPGQLNSKAILARILSEDLDFVMPETAANIPMSDYEKAIIVKWLEQGADYADHWAFIPPKKPAPQEVSILLDCLQHPRRLRRSKMTNHLTLTKNKLTACWPTRAMVSVWLLSG